MNKVKGENSEKINLDDVFRDLGYMTYTKNVLGRENIRLKKQNEELQKLLKTQAEPK